MAETKDKVVTVESLKALHDYDKEVYATKIELQNLFADGETVLSSYQYGDELPPAGTKGRIFFKRLSE